MKWTPSEAELHDKQIRDRNRVYLSAQSNLVTACKGKLREEKSVGSN